MNANFLLGLVLLLLPVPLAFVVPASPQASPDPWRVRRARWAVVLFALLVAIIQVALLLFEKQLYGGPAPGGGGSAVYGLYIWAVMSWFFLSALVVELRRAKPNPFPGHSKRSASLRPRNADEWIAKPIWWSLRITWLLAAVILLASVPDRISSSIVLLAAGGLLAAAPLLVRQYL